MLPSSAIRVACSRVSSRFGAAKITPASTTRATRMICQRGRLTIGREAFGLRSEEHTSELQSLMRISYAVFCLKKKTPVNHTHTKCHIPFKLSKNEIHRRIAKLTNHNKH